MIIATTVASDAKIQESARTLSAARVTQGLFPFGICAWDEIEILLHANQDVAVRFYPEYFADVATPKAAAFHLPEMRLSPHFSDPLNHLAELRGQLTTQKSAAVLAATTVQGMGGVGEDAVGLEILSCVSGGVCRGVVVFGGKRGGAGDGMHGVLR